MYVLPRQKLTTAQKNKRDTVSGKTWGESTIDFYIDEVDINTRDNVLDQYRLLEGVLNEQDYNYVLNPYNTTIDRYKRFGAKLRNYDIISPVVNLYQGEYGSRFKNFTVLESNDGQDNEYKQGLNDLILDYYRQKTINDVNALGIDTGADSVEQGNLEDTINSYNEDYDENRIISGQEILEFIYNDQDLDDKHQDAFRDWLVAGRTFTYKGIHHDDIDYEVVPPWQITVPEHTNSNFSEDAPWVVRRQVMTSNQILDRWHGKLTEQQVNWLETEGRYDTFGHTAGYVNLQSEWISDRDDYGRKSILQEVHGIEVFHVQWRTFKKVGLLTTIDELGQVVEIEVDDTYRMKKDQGDVSIEWDWQSEVWEGWRVGYEYSNIYLDVRPLPYNRMELNNSSAQKLSYNGRINKSVAGNILSVVTAGRPYQLIFNILHYQLEKAINKNKGKVMVIPQGVIPKGINGWDEEKFMYYTDASGMLIIDETQPTAGLALQAIKPLDLSLGQFAKESIELMQSVKQEFWDLIGMNRQRYGDIKASEGKGTSEQAVYRSAIISDELFRKFEKFQEKDYAGLLDLSKLAYLDGKKGKYVNSQGREAFLSLNADDALYKLESDYNVHVKNSRQESENIQMAKEFGFSLGQNGDAKTMLELIESTNFTKTKKIIEKIDEMNKAREQALQESQQASAEAIEQSKAQTQQSKNDVEIYKADKDYDKAIDVKLLEIQDNDLNNDGVPDNTRDVGGNDRETMNETIRMNNHKINADNKAHQLKRDEFKLKMRDQQIKKKESEAKIKQMNKPQPATSK